MASLRLVAHGRASRELIWERYADPARWHEWAPQIRSVQADGRLRPGLRGEVFGPPGVRARFEVETVDEAEGRWSWTATAGPARLRIEHEVGEGTAALVLHGSAIVIAAYAPIARLSLQRLVRGESVA